MLKRRDLLRGAVGIAAAWPSFARSAEMRQTMEEERSRPVSHFRLARFLNQTRYSDLPPRAIEHAR